MVKHRRSKNGRPHWPHEMRTTKKTSEDCASRRSNTNAHTKINNRRCKDEQDCRNSNNSSTMSLLFSSAAAAVGVYCSTTPTGSTTIAVTVATTVSRRKRRRNTIVLLWWLVISAAILYTSLVLHTTASPPSSSSSSSSAAEDEDDNDHDAKHHRLRNGTSGRISRRKEEEQQQQPQPRERNRAILYLHIGKTGGSTLDAILAANCRWHSQYESKHLGQRCHNTLVGYKKKKTTTNTNGLLGTEEEAHAQQSEEFRLSKLVKETIHMTETMNINSNKNNKSTSTMLQTVVTQAIERYNITTFLFTVRNPLDRLVSAFNMQHIQNTVHWPKRFHAQQPLRVQFYIECFPTIEDLARVLRQHDDAGDGGNANAGTTKPFTYIDTTTNTTRECYDLGLRAVHGTGHIFQGGPHMYYNYGKYYRATIGRTIQSNDSNNKKETNDNKDVFVLRTEHLWDDVNALNNNPRLLRDSRSGDGTTTTMTTTEKKEEEQQQRIHNVPPKQTFGSERKPVRSGLSPMGKHILCCYLRREIAIYEEILHRALNLNQSQKEHYLTEYLYADCNIGGNKSDVHNTATSIDNKFCPGGVPSYESN